MDKLLIFTNCNSIWNVDRSFERAYIESHRNFFDVNHGILKFVEDTLSGTFQVLELGANENINSADVFFLSDTIDQYRYNIFFNSKASEDNVYVLYHLHNHGNGNQFTLNLGVDNDHKVLGQNIMPASGLYSVALNILKDDDGDKCKRIIDALFRYKPKLEAALEFLHQCLIFEPDMQLLESQFSVDEINEIVHTIGFNGIADLIQYFSTRTEEVNMQDYSLYMQKFQSLREAILNRT